MIDHELAIDDEWASFHQFIADEIRKLDPNARVGAEGSEHADMERTLQGVQVWAPYESTTDSTALRSLASPQVLRSHWWGGYSGGAADASQLWQWLLEGKANFQEYFAAGGIEGLLNQNLTYRDYFLNLLPDLEEVNGGVGMLLAGSRVVSDRDVAIHYSRPSFHASAGAWVAGADRSVRSGLGQSIQRACAGLPVRQRG